MYICLSISHYEPSQWSPSWSLSTILSGLISFMNEETPTFGSINSSSLQKCKLAKASKKYNLNNKKFCEIFCNLAENIRRGLLNDNDKEHLKKTEIIYSDESDLDNYEETEGEKLI